MNKYFNGRVTFETRDSVEDIAAYTHMTANELLIGILGLIRKNENDGSGSFRLEVDSYNVIESTNLDE